MNKAAYLHSLAHVALVTHVFYMTTARNDYTEWVNIKDKYQKVFEDGILYVNQTYWRGENNLFHNVKENTIELFKNMPYD